MKLLSAGILFAVVLSAGAFDTVNFVKKYCYETSWQIKCSNFNFTAAEKNDIQSFNFVISNATRVVFEDCDIGSFNENLVNKFPNAVEIFFSKCNTNFNYAESPISSINTKLKRLEFIQSFSSINTSSPALSKLTALEDFSLWHYPDSMEPIFRAIFDEIFFSKNTKLKAVHIEGVHFDRVSSKAFINLKELTNLNLIYTGISYLDEALLRGNVNLKTASFDNNNIGNIPPNFFPPSIETISLSGNRIQIVPDNAFNGLTKLKNLNLAYNQIEDISNNLNLLPPSIEEIDLWGNIIQIVPDNAFNGLTKLKILNLGYNQIKEISNNLNLFPPSIEEIFLSGNSIQIVPDNAFNGLTKLKILYLGNNQIREISNNLNLPALEYLYINNNKLRAIRVSSFKNLEYIVINDNKP